MKEQAKPVNLDLIKNDVLKKWSSISLLDVLKETDYFVNFLDNFVPSGTKEVLGKNEIRKRLMLTILGYGTNTGLKSMIFGNKDMSYKDLQHIKLRYLDSENLKMSITGVTHFDKATTNFSCFQK